jgi:hypothetical protein
MYKINACSGSERQHNGIKLVLGIEIEIPGQFSNPGISGLGKRLGSQDCHP